MQYGHAISSLRGFSWKYGINQFGLPCGFPPHHLSALNGEADFPAPPAYRLEPGHPSPGWPTLLRHPFAQTLTTWYRNIDLFSITYAFRPRLRSRLTLGGLTFPRKPLVFGVRVLHPHLRYLSQHKHFQVLQWSSRSTFTGYWKASLPYTGNLYIRSFGSRLEPRYIFGAEPLDQ